MTKKIFTLILIALGQLAFAQDEELFNRLRAIDNGGITFYNVDGIDFSRETLKYDFNEKNLKRAYRKNKIKNKDAKETDALLAFDNYKFIDKEQFENGLVAVTVHYFVKNKDNGISVFWFGHYNKDNPAFEREIIGLILNDKIPQACFNSLKTDQINFAGREINLGGNCNWMNINNIQCPYYGQMNWSLHKTRESADLSIQNQLKATKSKSGGKVVSEEEVDIVFEGVPTKVKKVNYDFTGISSLLVSMSGGKNLTIYYVSAQVRDTYVSCVLSFWNNDNILLSGLPPLLEEVMSLEVK